MIEDYIYGVYNNLIHPFLYDMYYIFSRVTNLSTYPSQVMRKIIAHLVKVVNRQFSQIFVKIYREALERGALENEY